MDAFTPSDYVAVNISVTDRENPYSLAHPLVYHNDVVSVLCEAGFQWDGASIPYWWPLLPWLITLLLVWLAPGVLTASVAALLLLYTQRLLPWMQHIGPHVRAACVHDKLYRSRLVARVVADAILLNILEVDGVPVDIRYHIYGYVRLLGWLAWRSHTEETRLIAVRGVRVVGTSEAPC